VNESLRERLRALPDFPEILPEFDVAAAPENPRDLFLLWLEEALAIGSANAHTFSLSTATTDGKASGRMLILKDLDSRGWHFATSRTSRKGRELTATPWAAMTFYWPEHGRQLRLAGPVSELSAEESAADWDARPGTTGDVNVNWQVYALQPTEIEFWQASHDRRHIRHRYEPRG
jgi:pyridoxamine 5'-phosphate oxidase